MNRVKSSDVRAATLVALASSIAFACLFLPLKESGLAIGSDALMHVGNVVESAYLSEYKCPPWDWLPDICGGYGGPNYIYYGSFAFVVPAYLTRIGLSPIQAAKLSIAISILIAGASSFLWCRLRSSRICSIAGATLFTWCPYYLSLPYVRGSYPELFAVSMYPLVCYFAHRSIDTNRILLSIWAGGICSIVIWAHTLSIILLLPIVCIYMLLHSTMTKVQASPKLICCFMLSTCLLGGHCLIGPLFERTKVDIFRQFDTPKEFVDTSLPLDALLNNDPVSTYILSYIAPGRIHLLIWAICFVVVFLGRNLGNRKHAMISLLLSTVALMAIVHPIASFLSAIIPPVKYVQFPFRFLSIFCVFLCSCFSCILQSLKTWYKVAFAVLLPLLCCIYYQRFIPSQSQARFYTTRDAIRVFELEFSARREEVLTMLPAL
jgi:hypothetical protein